MTSPGDCGHLVKAGIPAVMYGPGDIRVTHVANEWIEIEKIIKAKEIHARIIMGFLS